jgi:two-component system response regulator MprA
MLANSPRILLIDDNKHGLTARRNILEQNGYFVEVACCGQDGLTRFENGAFDLVVTDFRMPDLNGPEVISRIRERAPRTPIVLLSGYAGILGLTESETGADIVLSKGPSEQAELVGAIGRLIRRPPGQERGAARSRSVGAAN